MFCNQLRGKRNKIFPKIKLKNYETSLHFNNFVPLCLTISFCLKNRPDISDTLLWEYDINTFHWDKSYKIVIERVLQMGNLKEWQEIVQFYSKEQILETIEWSAQLRPEEKQFSQFFLNSEFLNAA